MRRKLLAVLFGLVTAGSLGFGASQALAAPATAAVCGDTPHEFYLSCPVPRDCGAECARRGYPYGGFCSGNCCLCNF